MPERVAWLSVDPVRRKVDFYPKAIATRIEKSFNERDPWNPSSCVLGTDFFNATVHFHPSGSCYQTTPGMSMGRAGFKQPGYRSVKRVVKPADGGPVKVLSKQVHGEWRIASNEGEAEVTFDEMIPTDSIIDGEVASQAAAQVFRAWKGEDLSSGAWDVSVVVWQWCRGVPERQGNVMALTDEWWCPYLANENQLIEAAFAASQETVELTLLVDASHERQLSLKFTPGLSFGLQRDEARGKERTIRRVVKTVQEVKTMLDRMATPPIDPSELTQVLPPNTIPHHFFCPITQDIMQDPVKTHDGMTYDRPGIERWFVDHQTSPLTGLNLSSKALTPHASLRAQIDAFVQTHAHLITPAATPAGSSHNLLAHGGPSPEALAAAEALSEAAASSASSAAPMPPGGP